MQKRRSLMFFAAAAGTVAALVTAPLAMAEEYGGGGADNPLLPACETMGGSSVLGGQSTDCASPGNSQLTATPNDLGAGGMDDGFFGFGGW